MEVRNGLYIVHVTDNKVDFIRFMPTENTLHDNMERVFIDIAKEREETNYEW